jgi:hypothetical protein
MRSPSGAAAVLRETRRLLADVNMVVDGAVDLRATFVIHTDDSRSSTMEALTSKAPSKPTPAWESTLVATDTA